MLSLLQGGVQPCVVALRVPAVGDEVRHQRKVPGADGAAPGKAGPESSPHDALTLISSLWPRCCASESLLHSFLAHSDTSHLRCLDT